MSFLFLYPSPSFMSALRGICIIGNRECGMRFDKFDFNGGKKHGDRDNRIIIYISSVCT